MKKKINYINLIALLLCGLGSIKYLLSYISEKRIVDLVACIIIVVVFLVLIITLIIEKIYNKKKDNNVVGTKTMNSEEVRVIKISKDALYEFVYEKFIENQEQYFNVNSLDVNSLFDIDYENGSFIFIVSDEESTKFSSDIDLKQLIKKLPDTTKSMFEENRYKIYTKEELIKLCSKN